MKTTDLAKDLIYLMEVYNLNNVSNQDIENELGSINNTKLQKILYIVMGLALRVGLTPKESTINNEKNIVLSMFDELPEVWPYGPVFKNIYKHYTQLNQEALSANYTPSYEKQDGKNLLQQRDDEIMKFILQQIIDSNIAKQNAQDLSEWSHIDGSPWDSTYKTYKRYGVVIDNLKIKNYFTNLSKEDLYGLDADSIEQEVRIIKEKYAKYYSELPNR